MVRGRPPPGSPPGPERWRPPNESSEPPAVAAPPQSRELLRDSPSSWLEEATRERPAASAGDPRRIPRRPPASIPRRPPASIPRRPPATTPTPIPRRKSNSPRTATATARPSPTMGRARPPPLGSPTGPERWRPPNESSEPPAVAAPPSVHPDGEGVQPQLASGPREHVLPPAAAAGSGLPPPWASADDFDRLLHRLQQEHRRVQGECAALRRQGTGGSTSTGVSRSTGGSRAPVRPPADGDEQRARVRPPADGDDRQKVDEVRAGNSSRSISREAPDASELGTPWSEGSPSSRRTTGHTSRLNRSAASSAAAKAAWRRPFRMRAESHLECDTGSSEYIRSQVNKIIAEKIAWKRKYGGRGVFPIPGAKELKDRLAWVRQNRLFADVTTVMIVANAIYLGVEASVKLALMQSPESGLVWTEGHSAKYWLIADWVFCVFFLIEIVIKVAAYQVSFFGGSERWWNASECVALCAMVAAASMETSGQEETYIIVLLKNLRFSRVLRVIRTSKWKGALTLKTLVYTLTGSVQAFVSVILLVGGVIYGFSIMFLHGLRTELQDADADPSNREMLLEYFGSFPDAVMTLLMSVTGGMDWRDVAVALTDMNLFYLGAFVVYIVFTFLCLLNLTTGVFVNAAIESAAQNKKLAIETTHHKTLDLIHQVLEWFFQADTEFSGKVTLNQLRKLIGNEGVRELLIANDIEVASAAQIFHLLDRHGTGELSPEDFVDGLIRLQGRATAIDLASLRSVCDDLTHKIDKMEEAIGNIATSLSKSNASCTSTSIALAASGN